MATTTRVCIECEKPRPTSEFVGRRVCKDCIADKARISYSKKKELLLIAKEEEERKAWNDHIQRVNIILNQSMIGNVIQGDPDPFWSQELKTTKDEAYVISDWKDFSKLVLTIAGRKIRAQTDENDKLQTENEKLKHDVQLVETKYDKLQAENEKLKHDVQLVETKYNGQGVLLKMAQDEVKAVEEELQAEIQETMSQHIAQHEQEIRQFRVELEKVKGEVLIHENTVNQVTLQLKEKDDKILALQTELQQLKDQPGRPTAYHPGIQKGFVTLPNLAQIFNIKPEYKPDINTPPLTPPKTNSPPRVHVSKTRQCKSCVKTLPANQFDNAQHKCRECKQLGL